MVLGFCVSLWSSWCVITSLPSSVVFTWSLYCSYSSPSISLRSEACLSLNPPKAFCAQNGSVREVKLELEFKRYEEYEEKMREVYRPKGLLAFTTAAREYVRML